MTLINATGRLALKIVEIALCAPQSNAALERFFSQLKFIKTNLRTSLSEQSLNALLRIKVTGPSLQDFHKHHVEDVLTLWCNNKDRRLGGNKKKRQYKQRSQSNKRALNF